MFPETVKGDLEAGDMEDMADKKTLAIERDNSRAPAQDWSKGIVTHADAEALHGLVWNEGTPVGDHVVSGASVGNHKTGWGAMSSSRDGREQWLNQNRRENNVICRLGDTALGARRRRLKRDLTAGWARRRSRG
jgi:hypothetical protein